MIKLMRSFIMDAVKDFDRTNYRTGEEMEAFYDI